MSDFIENQYIRFKEHSISPETISEQLSYDVPTARKVAWPLFDAGIEHVAMGERQKRSNRLCRRPMHFITLILQGKARVQIEGDRSFAGPGDLVVIPTWTLFQEVINEPVWRITIQLMDTPNWKPLQDIRAYIREYESAPFLFILIRNILDAYRNQHPSDIRMALDNSRALVNLLNHEIVTKAGGMRPHRNKLKALFEEFSRNPGHKWTVAEMAERVSLSQGHFTSLFREEFNVSPLEAVIRERMQAAGMRLTTSDDLLEDISASVGYDSMYSFARLFKKHMGISPGKYRKLHQQREWE